MKSLFIISCYLTGLLCMTGCQKQTPVEHEELPALIKEAKTYFEATEKQSFSAETATLSPRKSISHTPGWTDAVVKQFSWGEVVIAPIIYDQPFLLTNNLSKRYAYSINEIRKLIMYKDVHGNFQVQSVTYLPDSLFFKKSNHTFSGVILVENRKGNLLNLYLAEQNGSIRKSPDKHKTSKEIAARLQQPATTICIYTEGYNYSIDDPEGVFWSELIGCSTFYPDDQQTGPKPGGIDYANVGSGKGSTYPTYSPFTVYSPDNPIGNVKDYLKCFYNMPGNEYRYSISLCVSQPEPGSRTAWSTQSPFNDDKNPVYVGHSYLILTQVTPSRTIVRNVGFYPSNGASPYSPSDQGVLNNDQQRSYDVKITISMTNSQFFTVLDFIKQANTIGFQYNLNTNNCSTFAINALNRAGFNIPATRGTWHHGEGCNPGDLGEDIRSMLLSSNMTRTTTYGTHPNQGTCHPIE